MRLLVVGACILYLPVTVGFTLQPTNSLRYRSLLAALDPAVTLENLSCSHDGGDNYQLNNVNFVLQRGAKAALIGRNGAGKSTLLKIIASETCKDKTADSGIRYSGKITSPRDVRVALVEQAPPMLAGVTVGDALLGIRGDQTDTESSNQSVFAAVRRYRLASENAMEDPDAFTKASAEMDRMSGWEVLTKVDEVASRLRVDGLLNQELSTLSGGERKRVALAAALVQSPDLLLLDEPTNFLSLAGVSWLADLLTSDDNLTILMVSHDRAFLDDVCDRMVELDQGQLYEYRGKYADYIRAKEERLSLEDAAVQSAKAKYRVELDWMRRQPQARQTKSKARIEAFYKLQKATKPKSRAGNVELDTGGEGRRIGGKILSFKNINLSFGDNAILKDFSYDFCRGDRICVTGANGCGKTTFIRVLAGELAPDSGVIEKGETVVLGVYDQLGIKVENPEQTALDFVVSCVQSHDHAAVGDASGEARKLLKTFEFPTERWNDPISRMSGGERRRLQLLEILSKKPNFLVLDEPSVDLDLPTLQSLESYLADFQGVLLVVSHDRFFADRVADHLFVFEGEGEVKDFQGTLSDYASALIEMENAKYCQASEISPEKKSAYKEDRVKRNESRNAARRAKKDLNNLETLLDRLRTQAEKIQTEIDESVNEGWSVLAEKLEKLDEVKKEIDEKEMAWMELAELVEGSEMEV